MVTVLSVTFLIKPLQVFFISAVLATVEVARSRPSLHDDGYPTTPCPRGAGHAIVLPASLVGQLLHAPGQRPRPPLRGASAPAAVRPAPGLGSTHLHLLVPCRRHPRRLPPSLQRRLGLWPPQRRRGRAPAADPGPLAGWRPPAARLRRHAHRTLRTVYRRGRHPPQPHARTRWREVRLRPRLGHSGRPGQASRPRHHRPTAAQQPVCPPERHRPTGQGSPGALPHQVGTRRRAVALGVPLAWPALPG